MTTFSDRPGYERTSSSLWKQREEYCASLIQKAWKVHKVRATGATMSKADDLVTSEDDEVTTASEAVSGAASLAISAKTGESTAAATKAKDDKESGEHLIEVKDAKEE